MIDLHAHTTCSDGSDSPEALVRLAAERGVRTLAVCDHDNTHAWPLARPVAAELGVELVCGVELSLVTERGTLHLLGYHFDPDHPALAARLRLEQERRASRNERMLETLDELGLVIPRDLLADIAAGGQVGRPHVARALVALGAVSSTQEAFDRWLAKGAPAYIPRSTLTMDESLALLHAAGGVAVLAHPYQTDLADGELAAAVAGWVAAGLDGIEAYYSQHTPAMVADYEALATRHGLVVTAGSDYHGLSKPHIALGDVPALPMSDEALLSALRDRAEQYR